MNRTRRGSGGSGSNDALTTGVQFISLVHQGINGLPMKPKKIGLWVAIGTALVLSACSWFTQPVKVDRSDPLQIAWMTVHLPAILIYAGTLAEHDPLMGGGVVFFILAQWSVVGFLAGVTVRDILLDRQLRDRIASTPFS